MWIYVGSYASVITRWSADPGTGLLGDSVVVAELPNPSWLDWHPSGQTVYAVSEQASGRVTAFRPTGDRWQELGSQPSGGDDPCHLAVTPQGDYVLVANYSSGTVTVLPVAADGSLGTATHTVQLPGAKPHAHQVVFAGDLVLVADLGNDEIRRFTLASGRLTPAGVAAGVPGCGTRHLVAHANGNFYAAAELDSTLLTYDPEWNLVGALRSTAAAESWPSGVVGSADGRFLYLANRGPDTIAVFRVDGPTLLAEVPTGGVWPRDIAFIGGRLHVANQRSGDIAVFDVDPHSGLPTLVGVTAVETPTRVLAG